MKKEKQGKNCRKNRKHIYTFYLFIDGMQGVTSGTTTYGGYMVCTLVCQVHIMRYLITRTETFTYSNAV